MASTTLPVAHLDASPPAISLASAPSAILALDLGTATGWAMQLAGGQIESGTTSFRPSRYDGGGMRYLRFRGWLDGIAADAAGVAAIYFEEVRRHIGTDAAHLYGAFSQRSPPGASSAASHTRACRSAASSGTSPARAMPTSRR